MVEMILTLEGKHFQRQYLLYIVEIIHGNDKYYYVGQTGDNNYIGKCKMLCKGSYLQHAIV